MNPGASLPVTNAILSRMRKMVLQSKPQMQEIEKKYGSMSYFDYVKQKNRLNLHKPFQQRKKEITDIIKKETIRTLGSQIAASVEDQLKKNDSMSTAEHTAPIGTPHTLGAGLSVSIPMFDNLDPKYRNVIILSCSGASFNNFLSLPRGLQFHVFKDKQIIENQISFFGRTADPKTLVFHPPYSYDSVLDIKKSLTNLYTEGKLEKEQLEKIQKIIHEIYLSPHALSQSDFCDQLTVTNYYLWKRLFSSFSPEQIPNFIMLSQEKILIQTILAYHLNFQTPIYNFMFNSKYHPLIEKYFDGISGAFNTKANLGTFLFWGISNDNMRLQLVKEGNKLVSKDGNFKVKLEPKTIRQALLDKKIFPSVLLTFVTFSFYYGLLLGGGASQPTYLTDMKIAYKKMMREVGDLQSLEDADHAVTDDFVFFRPHLAFIDAYGESISATGLDMYLYNNYKWKEIVEATKYITISEFMTILLPILYKQFCPDDKKEDALMNISRLDVEKFTGFDKKLPPISTF